jgi:hypothetical protein
MTFGPFPSQLANAIQKNYLERAFIDSLLNNLAYREIADKESFPGRIGDTITKTRMGLMIPNMTPLDPSMNSNIDNGLTPQQYTDEQYTLAIFQYPQIAPFINLVDDETTIASFAMRNSHNLGIVQATCLDRLARNALFNSYMSGNTWVTNTLGSTGPTVNVDDTRGFQTVVVGGNVVPVSTTNPLPVFINGNQYLITSFANSASNTSTSAITGGTSGSITSSTNILVADGTLGNAVVNQFGPVIIRPNARASTFALQSSDLLNMSTIRAAVALMRNNAVPRIRGSYNLYINATSMNELFEDPEFQLLNRGVSTRDPVYENAWVMDKFLDVRFVETTETFVQPPTSPITLTVQRPILCGAGALVEGQFDAGLDAIKNMSGQTGEMQNFKTVVDALGRKFNEQGFYMYLRKPIDSLGQIITQTSNWIGGFTVPTDVTTTPQIIPTASNAYFKRAVIIETA